MRVRVRVRVTLPSPSSASCVGQCAWSSLRLTSCALSSMKMALSASLLDIFCCPSCSGAARGSEFSADVGRGEGRGEGW